MTGEFSSMPAAAAPEPAAPSWVDRLGPRALHRAAPRLGPVLAGAGALLAYFGIVILSFDTSDVLEGDGDSNKLIGLMLTAAGVAAGYALLVAFREGGLATFGSAIAALLVPFMFFFLTYDEADAPPFSVDVMLLLSVLVWLAAYVLRPSRGRPIFLGLAALGLWLFILEQVESTFTLPFQLLPFAMVPAEGFGPEPQSAPDPLTIGIVCLVFALAYLLAAFMVDRRGWRGMAPPLFVVGFAALYTGFFSIQEDLEQAGSGILLAVASVAIVYVATRVERRGAAWVGAFGVALGIFWVLTDVFEETESTTGPAITLMILGALVALGADRWAAAINEPPEVVDVVAPAPVAPMVPPSPPAEPPPPPEIDLS